jgi:uncharacterized protein YqgC (DUF456 family)
LSFDAVWFGWAAVVLLFVLGVAGTVLPALPGVVLVFGGVLLGAWLDAFTRVPVWVVVVCGGLSALAFATDYVAALLGAKRVRASGWALAGAAAGTVAGIFTGFVGLLFMPLVGAMAGEWWAQRRAFDGNAHAQGKRAVEVGVATWLGIMIGTAVKLALVFLVIGIFVAALVF